jgi:hypothetical protein
LQKRPRSEFREELTSDKNRDRWRKRFSRGSGLKIGGLSKSCAAGFEAMLL